MAFHSPIQMLAYVLTIASIAPRCICWWKNELLMISYLVFRPRFVHDDTYLCLQGPVWDVQRP